MSNPAPDRLIMTTTMNVEGYRIREYLGLVRGVVVRAPTFSQGLIGGLKTIVGGQIREFTEMCEQTRQQATAELARHARQLGGNGVIGIGYDASEIGQSATEVLCYGTAVMLERISE
ncbi:YbjQ family protein [Longimicrobium sp.]|uniref:YbjQ family protein n=1 Tax=Longimicrobium sp. TaxID=2029185 RepID=UPI002D0E96A2|nr:YbjQ family protein [Longimicrobium sp.]HSU13006.1 YbjQ family protein [Longimicrobium sp.]